MNTVHWERMKQILEDALRLPSEQRQAFLDSVCTGDDELRAEIGSLIASHQEAGSQFLAAPAAKVLQFPGSDDDRLPRLQLIGHYRLIAEIGRGGMGIVYRAEDINLGRLVAIKFLPAEFASDWTAFERLQREARAASALDHPNICSIYELVEVEGQPFIVMQLLDGQTLSQRVETHTADASSRLQQSFTLAIQILKGLQAAHEKGVIHRDIKPANIFVTATGDAKILDFGLAKVLAQEAATEYSTDAFGSIPSRTNRAPSNVHLTQTGDAMGTAPYMSPEQIRGETIDARTDLFSFGSVLYEMTTGRRAFSGESAEQIRQAILHTEPLPMRKLNPKLPTELERIVKKALNKDREKRYQSAADLTEDLEKLKRQIESRRAAVRKAQSPWSLSMAGVLVAALIASGFYYRSRQNQRLPEKDTIVLADFANSTGDKVFDSTLKPALSARLNQSAFLNVISDEKVAWTLQKMLRPSNTALQPEVAREVCQRANIRSYVTGSISSLGNQYIVDLKAMNCRSGDALAQEQVTAPSKENVLNALNSAASKLQAELGARLASLPKLDLPLEDVTTSSLHALEAYSTGVKTDRQGGPAEALHYFQRAVELDPTFASAYSGVGGDYNALGETTRAAEYFSKAFQLREYASQRESLGITADYYSNATGELDRAVQAYHNLIANYPRLWGPHFALGNVYASQGVYDKAGDEFREAMRLGNENYYESLANTLLALQRFDEARKAIEDAQTRKVGTYLSHLQLYALAFLKADPKGMAEQQQWFAGRPDVEHDGIALASDTEAYAGHLIRARELTRQSVDSAMRADSKEAGAIWQENAALREAAFGNASEAKRLAAEGLKLSPESQGAQVEAALALAMIGDTAQPAGLTKKLRRRYPLDTQVNALWLSPIRAQLALDEGNLSAALAALPDAGALEFGQISFLNNLSCLYPAYIRGEVYLAAGQGTQAAAEFQKILDHSGIAWNCWTGALAHLGVARANVLQAKSANGADADAARSRARNAYKDFLILWKDGDPEIPILKQAQVEYAKLL